MWLDEENKDCEMNTVLLKSVPLHNSVLGALHLQRKLFQTKDSGSIHERLNIPQGLFS